MLVAYSPLVNAVGIVVLDAGHGGVPAEIPLCPTLCGPGNVNGVCYESNVNLNVQAAVFNHYQTNWYRTPILTRVADRCYCPSQRIAIATQNNAHAFFSIHHNPANVNRGFVMYCDDQYEPLSLRLADEIGQKLETIWIPNAYGLNYRSPCEDSLDTQCGLFHVSVLKRNTQPAALGEAAGLGGTVTVGTLLCNNNPATMLHLGSTYSNGIFGFLVETSIGTSFVAQEGNGFTINLAWTESDPERVVTYILWRANSCWGPYEFLDFVDSGDPAYTQDGAHYHYADLAADWRREYFYRLETVGEVVTASAMSPSQYDPVPPGTPTNVTAQHLGGSQVAVSWNASSGDVDGYHIFRSVMGPMGDCTTPHTYAGFTTLTSVVDTSVPHGWVASYRIQAFNETAPSAISGEATVETTTDVAAQRPALQRLQLRSIGIPTEAPTILLDVGSACVATIAVYDVAGRRIGQALTSYWAVGRYRLDLAQAVGTAIEVSGIYFVQASGTGGGTASTKVVVVR